MYECKTSSAQQLPSQQGAASDAASFLYSIYTFLYVLLSSAAFRIILSDVLLIARQTVADVAARVGDTAFAVEKAADNIQDAVRPGGSTSEDVQRKVAEAVDDITDAVLDGQSPDDVTGKRSGIADQMQQAQASMKESILRQLQDVREP